MINERPSDLNRFRQLIDNLHVGVVVQDAQARIVLNNKQALDLLGLTQDQLLGRTSFDPSWSVVREDGSNLPGESHPVPLAIATARPVRNVIMGVHRPTRGDRVWLLVDAEPELDDSGHVVEVVCTFSDITERKRLEESLLQAQKMEAIGRLAGGVAHDFNNLLTVIMGYLDPSMHDTGAIDRAELQLALDAAERAAALTRQLLAFARREVVSPRVVSLSDSVAALEAMLGRLVGEHIELRTYTPRSVWPIRIDPVQLEQVVLNLVVNARDAIEHAGSIRIETSNEILGSDYAASHVGVAPGEYSLLSISDTGPGVPKELQEHIFEPFFTTKPAGQGTGLGLATVHGIVKQHGGHIAMYSEPGAGTTFRIYFPRTEGAPNPVGSTTPPVASTPRATETVLLVEDEALVRGFAVRALERQGYHVLACGDPREAIERAQKHEGRIDLILTDIVMPHMSGLQLTIEVRRFLPGLRVLYVSGYTHSEQSVLDAGVAFLPKPYTPADLLTRVREVLRRPPR